MPELETLRRGWEGQGVGFLALSLEPDQALVTATAARLNINSRVAIAKSEALGPLGVNAVPATVFLRADGILNAVGMGYHPPKWHQARIAELVPPR